MSGFRIVRRVKLCFLSPGESSSLPYTPAKCSDCNTISYSHLYKPSLMRQEQLDLGSACAKGLLDSSPQGHHGILLLKLTNHGSIWRVLARDPPLE